MSSWKASCLEGNLTGPDWTPRNASDGRGSGSLRVVDATAGSVNTGYVAMANELDLCDIADMAEKVGFHRSDGADTEALPSMVLGTQLTSPLTMASAYATFAGEGTYCEPRAITRITDANGDEIEIPEANCREVISPEVANAVNYALTQVVEDRKSTRLNSSHVAISYAVFCLKKKKERISSVTFIGGVLSYGRHLGRSLDSRIQPRQPQALETAEDCTEIRSEQGCVTH